MPEGSALGACGVNVPSPFESRRWSFEVAWSTTMRSGPDWPSTSKATIRYVLLRPFGLVSVAEVANEAPVFMPILMEPDDDPAATSGFPSPFQSAAVHELR
jgi:hypothetical protein